MLESFQVFVLCVIIGLFLFWVMTLKKQIIALLEDNKRLKGRLKDKLTEELAGTTITKDQPHWGHKQG